MPPSVLVDHSEGVATIAFNRPESLNALTGETFLALRDAVAEAPVATLVVSYDGLDHRPDEVSPESGTTAGEDAVVDAQRRIFDWFDSHLR